MDFLQFDFIKSLSISGGIFAVTLLGFYFIWTLIDRQLTQWSKKTTSDLDDLLVVALRNPSRMLVLSLALMSSLHLAPFSSTIQMPLITGSKLILIIAFIWGVERLLATLIYSDKMPKSFSDSSRVLFRTISKTLVYSIGFLILLDTMGVSITPLLASLGVGSVAVALAAQETLSNLFSGFYILLDRPFRIGDCVKVDSGIEGFITQIGWRSTHIRLFSNNVVVIPNSKIASSMVTNYDFPESDTIVTIPLGVSYDSDLKKVEQVILEVAFLIQNTVPFSSKNLPPTMAFTEFGDFSINLNVTLRVQKITDAGAMRHEFIKALHLRFNQEGIQIPYPQYVVQWPKNNLN